MVRFLVNVLIFLGSAALGLWITSLFVDGFEITFVGLLIATLIFAALQAILSPLILKMTVKYAGALTGGVGLVSTFVALWLTTILSDELSISGLSAWLLGTLLVWLVTAIATWVLPMIFLRNQVEKRKG